jgi:GNAT superfamily N-acetyltransferase
MTVSSLTGEQTWERHGEIVEIYREVFTLPPWNMPESEAGVFRERLAADVRRPGFTAVLAQGQGFGTGWITAAPFPTGRSYGDIPQHVSAALVGALEVDELAVLPSAQGQGVGGRLLAALREQAGERGCWLLTATNAEDTVRFYRARGWRAVHEGEQITVFRSI